MGNNKSSSDDIFSNYNQTSTSLSELRSSNNKQGKEMGTVTEILGQISSGIRILEDRYYNLRKKTQLTDQALLDAQKTFIKEKKILGEEILETKRRLQELIDDLEVMKGELKEAVKQKDLNVLDKYLDMWEPMQFVTRKEVMDILTDMGLSDKDE